jgi:hypothetical protein
VNALQTAGFSRSISPYDVLNFEYGVYFYGLPSAVLSTLQLEGADAEAINQITQLAIVQDIYVVAGYYPQMLANTKLLDDLTAAGQALSGLGGNDATPPVTTATLAGPSGNNGWYTGPVTVTLSATDADGAADVAGTSYSVDGGAAQTYTTPFDVTGDGTHIVSFFSTDKAGNEETPHPSVTIKIDASPPAITAAADRSLLWPTNGKTVPVTIRGTIGDAISGLDAATASLSVVDEYGTVQPSGAVTIAGDGSFAVQVPLEARRNGDDLDGRTYTITVQASDLAGNTGAAQVVVIVPHDQGH